MTRNLKIVFSLSLALLIDSRPVDAIVVRHDRDDKTFIDLADRFPATVAFYLSERRGGFAGMGTLVDPKWVLTAGHVAEYLKPGSLAKLGGGRVLGALRIHDELGKGSGTSRQLVNANSPASSRQAARPS